MASSTKKNSKAATSSSANPVAAAPAAEPIAAPKSRGERRAEQFEQRRIDRKKAPEKQKRDKLLMRILFGGVAALLILGLGYGIFNYLSTRDENRKPEGVTSFQYAGGEHTSDPVTYTESPPVGGTHNPAWQQCGYYDGKIGNENAVHSLEHGAVWITYGPDTPEADKERLQQMADDRPYLLVSKYDGLGSPFVATAWNNQMPVETMDQKELTQFMNYYIQGPQTPERGATCSGGTDAIIG